MPTKPSTHKPAKPQTPRHNVQPYQRQTTRALHTGSKAWRSIREQQLQREPLCRFCLARGRRTIATDVDHIDGNATNDVETNYQSLCRRCHSRKTAMENGAFGRGRVGA